MAGKSGPETIQDGQADPVPAPAPDQEEGHLGTRGAPPFPAPRASEPLSTSTPENISENISEKNSTSAKRKPGREKGCQKTGGRTTAFTGLKPKEIREYLATNSEAVENLCRMARGKPIRRYGPSGKVFWSEVDFPAQKWAIEKVLERLAPALKSQEITGDADAPFAFKNAGEPLGATELARRAAYLLDAGARETDARRPAEAPHVVTAPGGSRLAPSGAPAPTLPAESSVFSDVYGHISGPRKTLPNGPDEPAPRTEPVPGEVADVGGYAIHCHEGTREGLPPTFQIRGDRGQIHAQAVGGWKGALAWVERHAPDGADLSVTITKPRLLGGGSRPDERAARSTWQPEIHGSYGHRKR